MVTAVHDVSDGGLLVAIAEMAMAGGIGAEVALPATAAEAFGEDQGRYVVTAAAGVEVPGAVLLGHVGGDAVAGVPVAALKARHEAFFRDWMEA